METLQQKLAKIDTKLGDMTIYEKEPEQAKQLSIERGQLQTELKQIEEHWLEKNDQLETSQIGPLVT